MENEIDIKQQSKSTKKYKIIYKKKKKKTDATQEVQGPPEATPAVATKKEHEKSRNIEASKQFRTYEEWINSSSID